MTDLHQGSLTQTLDSRHTLVVKLRAVRAVKLQLQCVKGIVNSKPCLTSLGTLGW